LATNQKIYQMKIMDVNEKNDGIIIVLHFSLSLRIQSCGL